jgi:hypothetical protein
MPTNKDLKRLVRGRMQKTGESYTAARSQVIRTVPAKKTSGAKPAAARRATTAQYALLAGMSDAAVKKATGCPWDRWVKALDGVDAQTWPHRRIVDYVHEHYHVPSWWGQMVTVGYERIKGLRERGQRRDGAYEATRSKVFPVPVSVLYRAFVDSRTRARWLKAGALEIRRATRERSIRAAWGDGTSVDIGFVAKGSAKSQVAIAHSNLASRADAAERKTFWSERLDVLMNMLRPSAASA